MNLTVLFFTILIVLVYTLFYTFYNNFSMFLFIILLLLSGFYVYQFAENKINIFYSKFDIVMDEIKLLKNNLIDKLNSL